MSVSAVEMLAESLSFDDEDEDDDEVVEEEEQVDADSMEISLQLLRE